MPPLAENEIRFVRVALGWVRSYNVATSGNAGTLLVCDAGNAMVPDDWQYWRGLTRRLRLYPHSTLKRDGSTARIGEKDKPVILIVPFLRHISRRIGKLVLKLDRGTRPWMLDKYFDASHFASWGNESTNAV